MLGAERRRRPHVPPPCVTHRRGSKHPARTRFRHVAAPRGAARAVKTRRRGGPCGARTAAKARRVNYTRKPLCVRTHCECVDAVVKHKCKAARSVVAQQLPQLRPAPYDGALAAGDQCPHFRAQGAQPCSDTAVNASRNRLAHARLAPGEKLDVGSRNAIAVGARALRAVLNLNWRADRQRWRRRAHRRHAHRDADGKVQTVGSLRRAAVRDSPHHEPGQCQRQSSHC